MPNNLNNHDRPIFVDIDGTLTDDPMRANGKPIQRRIDRVRLWIRGGRQVVIWSATGTEYAKTFCRRHSLTPMLACGKPTFVVDDSETITKEGLIVKPETYLDE